eukprot:CAMPEP_0174729246 /NCGR_PEP_ID=MMETSP1094-20130205/53328_1 /TAXON_ID=156173 /ORGANISM="Chrysochromulina brevifilum, Strain UTEX LB 985" /LENGTH=117 /DNA_ID=CAMNT_0015931323 /DNA_START=98 /DNA_END=451 /DNA_ORIENTATION=+
MRIASSVGGDNWLWQLRGDALAERVDGSSHIRKTLANLLTDGSDLGAKHLLSLFPLGHPLLAHRLEAYLGCWRLLLRRKRLLYRKRLRPVLAMTALRGGCGGGGGGGSFSDGLLQAN